MTALVVYFLIAVCVSFLCSLLEAVILSVSRAHIEVLIKDNHGSGPILKQLKERIDRPLSAILTLNTISHTVGAAGVGAAAQAIWGSHVVAVTSAVLTFAILVFSEIIPKTLGATYWKKLSPGVAYIVHWLIQFIYPLVLLFEALANWISPKGGRTKMSREELLMAAELGELEGILLEEETRIIKNILHLNNIKAEDVMTPRSVIMTLPKEQRVEDVIQEYRPIRFSRIPVHAEDQDHIIGFVHRYKILHAYSNHDKSVRIETLATPIHAVPESTSCGTILHEMIQRREQIFLVVDEYGGTAGLITLEDVIETLLGVEIVDEYDSVEDMRKLAMEQGARMRLERIKRMEHWRKHKKHEDRPGEA